MKFKELTKEKQWGVYRLKPRDNEKLGKLPVDPKTGIEGNQNKPETWLTYYEAKTYIESYNGLSVYMGNGLWLLDIDNIRADIDDYQSGNPKADNKVVAARKLTKGSYAEVSVSGNGIHILFIYNGKEPHRRERLNGIELYSSGRHCAMTFNSLDPIENAEIKELTAYELLKLIEFYGLNEPKARTPTNKPNSVVLTNCQIFRDEQGHYCRRLTADEVIEEMRRYNGPAWGLFSRGIEAYENNDNSSADLALCNNLAYLSACDPYTMDEVFRQSALYRPKWDRLATDRATNKTYGEVTIQKAINGNEKCYYKWVKPDFGYKFGFN